LVPALMGVQTPRKLLYPLTFLLKQRASEVIALFFITCFLLYSEILFLIKASDIFENNFLDKLKPVFNFLLYL